MAEIGPASPPHGIVICDEAATDELRVGTYRYFKNIERTRE